MIRLKNIVSSKTERESTAYFRSYSCCSTYSPRHKNGNATIYAKQNIN